MPLQVLEKNLDDAAYGERIRFKATFEFLDMLRKYMAHIENNYFEANDVQVERYFVPASYVEERFRALDKIPLARRFDRVAKDIAGRVEILQKIELKAPQVNKIRTDVKKMFRITTIQALYKDFYDWIERPDLFKKRRGKLEYSDVFPLVYLKIMFEGSRSFSEVKHLLVDEMQDYTPVQYAVLSKLFPCRKTILGDANQSVNPFSSSRHEDIARVFPNAQTMKLTKSYRSTYEITNFAQNISRNDELDSIKRHVDDPAITELKTKETEISHIGNRIGDFRESGSQSMGIICKNQKQADAFHAALKDQYNEVYLLNSESVAYVNGIIISTAHMAKGLEFDHVIVLGTDAKNYQNEVDKSMLYIACTRAMHWLELTYTGKISPLLNN